MSPLGRVEQRGVFAGGNFDLPRDSNYQELEWVQKAFESTQTGATVACLLPARTDTQWWYRYVLNASEIRYTEGRLKFGGSVNSALSPSAVVIFRSLETHSGQELSNEECSLSEPR